MSTWGEGSGEGRKGIKEEINPFRNKFLSSKNHEHKQKKTPEYQ